MASLLWKFLTGGVLIAALSACSGSSNGSDREPPPPSDTTPPVISLIGPNPQLIAFGHMYTELGAMASDNVDGDISALIVIDASAVDTTTPGNYAVNYDVSDNAGNAADTVARTVTVLDPLPPQAGIKATPSIVLSGSSATLTWGSIYADSCEASGDWNDPIETSGTLTTGPLNEAATYTVNCSGGGGIATASAAVYLTTFPVASVSLEIRPGALEVGQSAQAVATAYDSGNMPLQGRLITWTSDNPTVATISADGRIIGRLPGEATILAESEDQSEQFDLTVIAPGPDDRQLRIDAMYAQLAGRIEDAIAYNESLLPGNPLLYDVIVALLELLRTPTLEEEIRTENRVEAAAAVSMNGRRLPIVAMFPRADSRENAIRANGYGQLALPLLEDFLQTPFAYDSISLWYGFYIGNRGGGGAVFTEDQLTYETRRGPLVLGYLPFEAIIQHEIVHSYFGHEHLTQFLELYLYNRVYTNSLDVDSWIFTRDYVPFLESNAYTHGLLDIYQLIGHDAMARAFQALYLLKPPYGQPLTEEGKQAIVNEAPLAQQSQVRAILDRGI